MAAPSPGRCVYEARSRRLAAGRAGLYLFILAVVLWLILFGLGGLSALYDNLGHLALTRGLLQTEGPERDALLTTAGRRFQDALRWNPENGWAYHNLGSIYLAWGQKRAAQEAFEQAATLNPDSQLTSHHLAILYDEQGQEDRAIAWWQRARAAPWLVREGRTCQAAGDPTCAERYYRLAIAVQPGYQDAHYRLGVLYAGQGRKAEAAESYRRALTLESERSPGRYMIQASALALDGRWEEAIGACQRAIELDPFDAEPYEEIGSILLRQFEDVQGAIEWYTAAIRVDPRRAGLHRTLAEIYEGSGDCLQAERYYRQALDLSGDNPFAAAQAHAGLSRCALDRGDLAAAEQEAVAAVDVQPQAATYRVLLADVYVEMKRYPLAIAGYREALGLDPSNGRARQQLEALGWREP